VIAITKNVAKTITTEVRVPPHSNYTESVFLASEGEVLLSTNGSCQLSQTPQDKRYAYRTAGRAMKPENVKGLPLPWKVPLDSSPTSLAFGGEAENPKPSTYYVAKARKTRVTSSKREDLKSAQNAECANHAIVTTEDFAVSEEDYQKMQEGGLVILKDEVKTRAQGCVETRVCTSVGPRACGYSGWVNPQTNRGFSFHQVSTGSICVLCKLKIMEDLNQCSTPGICWCEDITDKEKLMNCVFNSTAQELKIAMDEPEEPVEPDEPGQNEPEEPGRKRRSVVTQTTTFSGDKFDEKSFKIEMPPHQGNDGLTVVMHAASNGYWHLSNLKDNMLFKKGDQCLIATIPSGFFPIDGALGMKEIADVIEEQDYLEEHSALMDEGAMTGTSLKPPIKEECSASFTRRVTPTKLTTEQASILEEGGIVLHPQVTKAGCSVRKALISTSATSASWYWPNTDTGSQVALKKTIHDVKHVTCCNDATITGADQPSCCDTTFPSLCLCDRVNNQTNFLNCLGKSNTSWHGQCVKDTSKRLLPLGPLDLGNNTPMNCMKRCREEGDGYAYAGVQHRHQCFCGNDPPPSNTVRDMAGCNMPCNGDGDMKCGGVWRMNVYATGSKVVACERQSLEMSCQAGERIHVVEAAYGRSNNVICPTHWQPNTLCLANNSLSVVSNRCNDRERCSVAASNSVFGDPCVGIGKYLEVLYTCKPNIEEKPDIEVD